MDKYVLVTNANSQIGNEIVKKLIAENYIVFAGDDGFEYKEFGNLLYINLDPKSSQSLAYAKKYIQKFTSKLYAIIHLGSYIAYSALVECKINELEESINKNFLYAVRIDQEFWDLIEQRTGKIIHNCADVSLFELAPFNGIFGLSKSLLSNYVDVLRRELSFRGINVVKLHTGLIKDNHFEEIIEKYYKASEDSKYFYSEIGRFINLNIDRTNILDVDEYTTFLVHVVKQKRVKPIYHYKVSHKLSKISRHGKLRVDQIFKKYEK